MRQRANISDVAEAAGVSKSVVSNSLTGKGRVGKATRQRVLEAADSLGWRPSRQARGLSESRSYAVGIVFARDVAILGAEPFFAPFIAGLQQQLGLQGYMLLLQVDTSGDEAHELDAYRTLHAEGHVDAVVLTDVRVNDPRIQLLADLGMPFVSLGSPVEVTTGAIVSNDEEHSTRLILEHLSALGHHSIAFIAGPETFFHSVRCRGAIMAISRELGIEATIVDADFTMATGARATRKLLDGPDLPSAIVFANSLMAIAGLKVIRERGVSVPDEISIVSLDDNPFAPFISPPLTSIGSDNINLGRLCVDQLMELLSGNQRPPELSIMNSLVVRGSTATAVQRSIRR